MDQAEILAQEVWKTASERLIRDQETGELYSTWFSKLTPLRCVSKEEGETIVLGVPSNFFGEVISENYHQYMVSALSGVDGVDYLYEWEEHLVVPDDEPASVTASAQPRVVKYSNPQRPQLKPGIGRVFSFKNFVVGDENRHAFAAAKAARLSATTVKILMAF